MKLATFFCNPSTILPSTSINFTYSHASLSISSQVAYVGWLPWHSFTTLLTSSLLSGSFNAGFIEEHDSREKNKMQSNYEQSRFPIYYLSIPVGGLWLFWLSVVTMAFLYNAIVIFLRGAFQDKYQTSKNIGYWLTCDYLCDFIYIIDMLLFRARLMFFQAGQGIVSFSYLVLPRDLYSTNSLKPGPVLRSHLTKRNIDPRLTSSPKFLTK